MKRCHNEVVSVLNGALAADDLMDECDGLAWPAAG